MADTRVMYVVCVVDEGVHSCIAVRDSFPTAKLAANTHRIGQRVYDKQGKEIKPHREFKGDWHSKEGQGDKQFRDVDGASIQYTISPIVYS